MSADSINNNTSTSLILQPSSAELERMNRQNQKPLTHDDEGKNYNTTSHNNNDDDAINNNNNPTSNHQKGTNCFILLTAALGGILFGYDTAIVNGGLFQMRKSFNFDLDSWQNGLIVAIGVAGAFIGSAIGGWAGDRYGRKKTIIAADILFVIGSVVIAAAPDYETVLVGRIIIGLGIGLSSVMTPVFLAEITPPETRGQAVTLNNFCLTGAQFLASVVAIIFVATEPTTSSDADSNPYGWRAMFGLGVVPAILQIILFQCLPESPRWLILVKRPREEVVACVEALGLDPEFIEQQEAEMARLPERSIVDLITQRGLRKRLLVACGLQFFQQIDGINSIMYYSSEILKHAGFSGDKDPVYFSAPLAFINAIFTLVGTWYVERAGRRPLLLASLVGCLLSTVAFCIVGFTSHDPPSKTSAILFMVFLATYLMSFAPGIGSLPWVLGSEIFPIDFRSSAASIATMSNWASNTLVSQLFPILIGKIGLAWTFAMISVFIACSIVFAWFVVPETKGLTLEEIERHFPGDNQDEEHERIVE